MSEATPILSAKTAAERLGRPERTLERWRTTGDGPPYIRLGRRVGYPADLFDKWLAERTFPHRAAELAQRSAAG